MFRIAYFIMWTGTFVICQWIIHACVSMRLVVQPFSYAFQNLRSCLSVFFY